MQEENRRRRLRPADTALVPAETSSSGRAGTAHPRSAGARLAAMRGAAPSLHQITPPETLPFQATALCAAGGHPVPCTNREEVIEIVAATAGLTLAIGALTPALLDTMLWAAETARGAAHPWVLDAAGIGLTDYRRQPSAALLARRPTAVTGDATDILCIAGIGGAAVDRALSPEDAVDAGAHLAQRVGAIIVIAGAADGADMVLTDGNRAAVVHGGDPMVAHLHGHAAARSALLAAMLATSAGAFEAAAAALALDAAAAFEAGRRASGPGSFAAGYLDSLATLTPDALDEVTRITPL